MKRLLCSLLLLLLPLTLHAQSVLATEVADMAPGEWRELTGHGLSFDMIHNPCGGHPITVYAESAIWNPTSRQVTFWGAPHCPTAPSGQGFNVLTYDEATNAFSYCNHLTSATCPPMTLAPKPGVPQSGDGINNHGMDHTVYDPVRNEFYRFIGGASTLFARYNMGQTLDGPEDWTLITPNVGTQIAVGLAYHPDLDYGQGGIVMAIFSGTTSTIYIYHRASGTTTLAGTITPSYGPSQGYHQVAEYSAGCRCVMAGGGNGYQGLGIVWADGSFTQTFAPGNVHPGITTGRLAVDPVSGEFLVLNNDQTFWSYNALTDTWTDLPEPPMSVTFFHQLDELIDNVIHVPITNVGATMFIDDQQKVWIYKHANLQTFAQKCALAGVINCFGFDSQSIMRYNWDSGDGVCSVQMPAAGFVRYNFTNFRGPTEGNAAAIAQNGECMYPVIDTNIKNSGAGSLHFTVKPFTDANSSGFWGEPFDGIGNPFVCISPDCASGNVVWWQFKQYVTADLLNNIFICIGGSELDPGCGGWKQIIWYGQPPLGSSASNMEITHNNGNQKGAATMYGQRGFDGYGIQDIRGCSTNFNGIHTYPEPPCKRFVAGRWQEFTVRVEILGTYNQAASKVQMWVDGELAIAMQTARVDWTPVMGNPQGLGQFQITPYHTNKSSLDDHPIGHMYIDDLIISTQPIPMTFSDVVAADATNALAFSVHPSNIQTGSTFSPAVAVEILLPGGSRDTSATDSITLAINGCGATLTGTTTRSASSGVATFTGLGATTAASSCTLTATANGITTAISNSFNVTAAPVVGAGARGRMRR